MAIAFDTAKSGGTTSLGTLTWSHTCTGSDLVLIVSVNYDQGTGSISSVTYAGAALTQIATGAQVGSGNTSTLWIKVGPATGANNVVVTPTVGLFLAGASASYTGCAQSGQPDSSNTKAEASVTTQTTSTTVVASGCWLVMNGSANSGAANVSAGTGTIKRANLNFVQYGYFDSNGTVGTGSQSLIFNSNTTANGMVSVIASIKPVATTTSVTHLLGSLGAGA